MCTLSNVYKLLDTRNGYTFQTKFEFNVFLENLKIIVVKFKLCKLVRF